MNEGRAAREDLISKDVGTTISVNHDACGDTRGRLRITKVEPVNYIAFCHNCSARGYYRTFGALRTETYGRGVSALAPEDSSKCTWSPLEFNEGMKRWDTAIGAASILGIRREWAAHGLVSPAYLHAADLQVWGSVYFLQFRNDGGEVYSGQTWERESDGSKSFLGTYHMPGIPSPMGRACVVDAHSNFNPSQSCVVVEDRVSAMLGSLVCPSVHWVALHGSHMDTYDMAKISAYYKNVMIWLDNDNEDILAKSSKYTDCLQLMGTHAYACNYLHEPKKCFIDVVKQQVENFVTHAP